MLFPPSHALSVGSSPSQLSANLTWLASITPSLVHQHFSSFNWMDVLNQQRLRYSLHYIHSHSSVSISKHLWAQPHLTIPICKSQWLQAHHRGERPSRSLPALSLENHTSKLPKMTRPRILQSMHHKDCKLNPAM